MGTVRIKKKGQQFKIYIDDVYVGLFFKGDFKRVDMGIPEEEDSYVTFDNDNVTSEIRDIIYDRAYQKAVGYLAVSEYPASVIKNKLYMKGFSESIVQDVIDVLYESRYLDDGRFVESYTRSYIKTKSRDLIEREISDRGVDVTSYRDVIDDVYEDEGVTEADVIENLLRKKYLDADFSDIKLKRRAVSYLLRHGFTYDKINNYLT